MNVSLARDTSKNLDRAIKHRVLTDKDLFKINNIILNRLELEILGTGKEYNPKEE